MGVNPSDVLVLFVTVGNEDEALNIARAIVNEKLAACVNIIPAIRSIYMWQGEVCDDKELLLLIKAPRRLFSKLMSRIKELHSYEVPEVIAVSLSEGIEDYLSWVVDVTEQEAS